MTVVHVSSLHVLGISLVPLGPPICEICHLRLETLKLRTETQVGTGKNIKYPRTIGLRRGVWGVGFRVRVWGLGLGFGV